MFTKTKSYDENTEIIKGNPTLKELEKIVVKVNDCYVPENYGRPIVQHHVNVLAAIFDFKKVGEITISKIPNQNGKLYEICDGNHRHQAMQKKNMEMTFSLRHPCYQMVYQKNKGPKNIK